MEHNHFFDGGHLIDVEIDFSSMEYYLQENENEFKKLAEEFFKRL